jgi:hypothetical protein
LNPGTHGRCKFEVCNSHIHPRYVILIRTTGCSIWAVELLRREIVKLKSDAKINAILIDFFLYDLAKEKEREEADVIPHHRTRSIWY